jgi:hypothetical protein
MTAFFLLVMFVGEIRAAQKQAEEKEQIVAVANRSIERFLIIAIWRV